MNLLTNLIRRPWVLIAGFRSASYPRLSWRREALPTGRCWRRTWLRRISTQQYQFVVGLRCLRCFHRRHHGHALAIGRAIT